jgi:probable HAF family extracellular repeat protein
MKFTNVKTVTALALFAASAIPFGAAAQQPAKHHQYKVIDLGTLGGPGSTVPGSSHVLTAQGTVAGGADTPAANPNPGCFNPITSPDCSVQHAFHWQNGVLTDLGALPGGSNSFPFAISESGWEVGASENGGFDPILGIPTFVAVLWRNGQIANLGTLGGDESLAVDVKDHGLIVGFSSNSVPDPVSMFGFATQTRPFIWQNGVMQDLGTLGGPDGAAFLMNVHGQIIGQYQLNSTPNATTGIPTQGPILWQANGTAVDLGTLGGTLGTTNWINNRGQVVGQSNLAGDATFHSFLWDQGALTDLGTLGGNNSTAFALNDGGVAAGRADVPGSLTHHGFRWERGVITDLGTITGAVCSTANSINAQGQIVGDAGVCFVGGTGWLWEDGGPIVDLNALAIPGSGFHVGEAHEINNAGEIVCNGVLPNGNIHAILLVPQSACDDACEARIAASQLNQAAIPASATTSGLKTTKWTRFANRRHLRNPASPSN